MTDVASRTDARVCIAVPTFRRPEQLATLLGSFANQIVPTGFSIDVLVIDNDVRPTARSIVEACRDAVPFPLAYAHVPEPGLSSVRNHALAHATAGFDYLAMMDDDQLPVPQWIGELLRVQRLTDADAVIGPVDAAVPSNAPEWIRTGGFFRPWSFRDGAPIAFGNSGNCMVRVSALRRYGLGFDRELDFAGGEDFLFFAQLLARGGSMTFAAHALAIEGLGAERLTARYLIRRDFRRGNTLAMCDRRLRRGVAALAVRSAKGCARLALGVAALLPLAVVRRRSGIVLALSNIAHGIGTLAGLAGHVHLEYKR